MQKAIKRSDTTSSKTAPLFFQLLSAKRFAPLFWTQFLGAFNDNFFKNALIILITYKTSEVLGIPSSQMVPVAGGIFILPFFLFSAAAGQLADKLEKAQLIRWIKIAEIAIMVLAFIGFHFHRYEFLLLVLFLMGAHSALFGPLKYSILPQLLGKTELLSGTALVEAGTFLAILLGTIVGGVLIAIENTGVYFVSLGLILTAILGWLASRAIPQALPPDPRLKIRWDIFKPTWEICKFTLGNRRVSFGILSISWFWCYGAAMLSLFPPYCKDLLKAEPEVVTLFLALFSVGIAVGSVFVGLLSRTKLRLGFTALGAFGISVFTADLYFIGSPDLGATTVISLFQQFTGLRILGDLFFLSVFGGFFIVPLYTLIQQDSDPSHRSRVIAANNVINSLFMVFAALFLFLFMRFGLSIPQILLTLALLNLVVGLGFFKIGLAPLKAEP